MHRFTFSHLRARSSPTSVRSTGQCFASGARIERGSVTAESALVLPLVAAFALAMVWMITLGIAQVRSVDASRDAARALARGEDQSAAVSLAERTAPRGARVAVSGDDATVTVTVTTVVSPPAWLLVPLPVTTIDASASVQVEGDEPDD